MDDLSARLRAADPLTTESGLSAVDAAAIRRRVVAAADRQATAVASWPRPLFVAATIAVTISVGVAIGGGFTRPDTRASYSRAPAPRAQLTTSLAERRQLQFATPGGTRIIWVFDPDFNP